MSSPETTPPPHEEEDQQSLPLAAAAAATSIVKVFPGPVMVVFLLCTLTGRCHCFGCGFDQDYLCAATQCEGRGAR